MVISLSFIVLGIDAETIDEIKKDLEEQGDSWWVFHHFGIGMTIRNLLRKGGFDWADDTIDRY